MKQEILPESKQNKIKKELHDLVISSTSHGLPNIFNSKTKFFKIMWTLFFSFSFGFCSFTIIETFRLYLSWEYVTNIDVIQEIPTEFPAITICNLNPFATDYAQSILNDLIKQNQDVFDVNTYEKMYTSSMELRILFLFFTMNQNFSDKNRKNFSLSSEDFIIGCNYGLGNCTADEFYFTYNMFYGTCYTFNNGRNSSRDILNSNQAGIMNGLRLELFLGNQSAVTKLIQNSGVHVFVHNKSVLPSPVDGIDVSSGELTNIAIEKSFVKKLEYPYNDCQSNLNNPDVFDSEIFKVFLKSNKTYTQKRCFEACIQIELIEKCSCYNPFLFKLNSSNICDNSSEITCVSNVYELFYKQDVNKKCSPYCPLECDSITYSLSVSHSSYPNPEYAKYLKSQPIIQSKFQNSKTSSINSTLDKNYSIEISDRELKQSIAAIRIYYNDLKYTFVTQIPKMNILDLLANVGGQLGLFIGISFLSFVEIFDAIFRVIFILFEKSDIISVLP